MSNWENRQQQKKPILSQRLLQHLEEAGIDIVSVNRRHLQQVAELKLYDDHRDPNDRLIIAQAIADKTVLISSDRKFERYNNLGLHFIFNKR